MKRWLTLTLLVLGLASPALAQTWRTGPGATDNATPNQRLIPGGTSYYFMAEDATTDSGTLDTSMCESITVEMVTIPVAASEALVYIRTVNTKGATCSTGRKVLADIDGGGIDDIPLNGDHGADEDVDGISEGRAFLWGFGPLRYLCADLTGYPGTGGDEGADTAYIAVTCGGD